MVTYSINNFLKTPVTGDTQLFVRDSAGSIVRIIYGGSIANVFVNDNKLIVRFTASTLPFVMSFPSNTDAAAAMVQFETYYSNITYHPLPTGITGNNVPLATYIDKGGVPTLPSYFPQGNYLRGDNTWQNDILYYMPTGSVLIGDINNTGQPQFLTGDINVAITGWVTIPDQTIQDKLVGSLTGSTAPVGPTDNFNTAIGKLQNQVDFYAGGLAGTGIFTSDITVVLSGTKTLGKYTNGQVIPAIGLNIIQLLTDIATEYLVPAFTTFYISGQPSEVEVGDVLTAGPYTFIWGTTNSGNITPNSISITDITTSTLLVSGLPNTGSDVYTFGSDIDFNTTGNHTFQIAATNTESNIFTYNYSINIEYVIFYGPSTIAPTNSAEVRSLSSTRFTNSGNTFILNTGSVDTIFTVAMPTGYTIIDVIDLDALSADITSQYILSTFNVNDGGGNPVSYHIYTMTQGIPYSSSHRHQITIS